MFFKELSEITEELPGNVSIKVWLAKVQGPNGIDRNLSDVVNAGTYSSSMDHMAGGILIFSQIPLFLARSQHFWVKMAGYFGDSL